MPILCEGEMDFQRVRPHERSSNYRQDIFSRSKHITERSERKGNRDTKNGGMYPSLVRHQGGVEPNIEHVELAFQISHN